MADISKEINDFRNAIYGEDVRGSMISLAEKLNQEVSNNTEDVDWTLERIAESEEGRQNAEYERMAAETARREAEELRERTAARFDDAIASAESHANLSMSYAVGGTGAREGEAADNSRYYSEQAKEAYEDANELKNDVIRMLNAGELTGEQGPQGEAGPQGPQGEPGDITKSVIVDTYGIAGAVGGDATVQELFDAAGEMLVGDPEDPASGVVTRVMIAQQQENNTNKVPSSALVFEMNETMEQAVERLELLFAPPIPVTLLADGWTGDTAPYSQTVEVEGVMEKYNYSIVSLLPAGSTPEVQETYMAALGILGSGSGASADGSITYYVYEKPETDIAVGLKGDGLSG